MQRNYPLPEDSTPPLRGAPQTSGGAYPAQTKKIRRTVINIKGESYRLKERKEFMRQKQQIVNTLFEQGNV